MTTPLKSIADRLVEYCRTGQEARGLDELYDPAVVSVEAMAMPGTGSAESVGLDALKGKHAWWAQAFEVHGADVQGPFLHGDDQFAVVFSIDATERASGKRNAMKEVAVYTVANGRIRREAFFYG